MVTLSRSSSAGGCCWQTGRGLFQPASQTITDFGNFPFQTAIEFNTCSGWDPPYEVYDADLSYGWPSSWNGSVVSASDAAEDTLAFFYTIYDIDQFCNVREFYKGKVAPVSSCDLARISTHAPGGLWSLTSPCTAQTSNCSHCRDNCCPKIKAYWVCKGTLEQIAQAEYEACYANCTTDHC